MIIPVCISVKNFLSIEDLYFEFDEGSTLPVFGLNLTDSGKESNGSGKSSFQQAIEFALKRSTSRYNRDSLLIQRGKDEALIDLTLFNTVTEETIQLIHTIRKKGSQFTIKVNDVDVEVSGVDEAKRWFYDYLGISSEDLSSFYLPNERNYIPFFSGSNTKKVALISRLSNLGLVDIAVEKVGGQISEQEDLLAASQQKISNLEAQISAYEDQKASINVEDFEQSKLDDIDNFERKIESYVESNKKLDEQILEIRDKISGSKVLKDSLVKKLEELDKKLNEVPKVDEILSKIDEFNEVKGELINLKKGIQESYRQGEDSLKPLIKERGHYENVLSGEITCPNCDFKFLLRDDITLDEAKSKLEEILENIKLKQSGLDVLTSKLEDLSEGIDEVDEKVDENSEKVSEVNRLKASISNSVSQVNASIQKIKNDNNLYQTKIQGIVDQISLNNSEIEGLRLKIENKANEEFDDSRIIELNKLIEGKRDLISQESKNLDKLGQKVSNLKLWVAHLQKFKSFLANKQLKVIQGLANNQLRGMGVDMQIKIDGFKTLANGEIREKITGYIVENGDVAEYAEFSKGERARIDYAMILAMQNLCNFASPNGGLDLLFADEISEGIDPMGNGLLLDSISKTGRTSLIVSHVGTNTPDGMCVMAVKLNGVTQIKRGLKHELEKQYQQL